MPEQHDEALIEEAEPSSQPGPEGERTMRQRIRGNRRSLELTGLIFVLFLINFLWSSHTATTAADARAQAAAVAQAKTQKAVSAACDFWYPLTSLPVTAVNGKASELSVHIIAGARESYMGQCSPPHPPLPPPDPSFTHWAAVYHVPVADP